MPECEYKYCYCFDADCRARHCAGCAVTVEKVVLAYLTADADFSADFVNVSS